MRHWGTWVSGHGGDGLMAGPDDLRYLLQPSWFYDSEDLIAEIESIHLHTKGLSQTCRENVLVSTQEICICTVRYIYAHMCVCSSPKPCWIVVSISLQTPVVPVRRCLVNDSFLDFLFQNNHFKLFFLDASLVFRHEPYLIFGPPFSLFIIPQAGECNAYWISCDCIILQIFAFNYDERRRGRWNFSPFGHSLRLDSLLLITTHCLQLLSQFSINTNLQTAHMEASLNYFCKRAFLRCPAKLSAIAELRW